MFSMLHRDFKLLILFVSNGNFVFNDTSFETQVKMEKKKMKKKRQLLKLSLLVVLANKAASSTAMSLKHQ